MKILSRAIAAATAALFTAGALAQAGTVPNSGMPTAVATPAQAGTPDRGDRGFMEKAAEGGLFEVQASRLAQDRALDPAVKRFAAMLAEQHTAANGELTQLAGDIGVRLPADVPRGMRKTLDKLAKLSGAPFDRAYVEEVALKDHRKAIELFEQASKQAKDARLKAWIDKTLPVLREHLAHARKLSPSVAKPAG